MSSAAKPFHRVVAAVVLPVLGALGLGEGALGHRLLHRRQLALPGRRVVGRGWRGAELVGTRQYPQLPGAGQWLQRRLHEGRWGRHPVPIALQAPTAIPGRSGLVLGPMGEGALADGLPQGQTGIGVALDVEPGLQPRHGRLLGQVGEAIRSGIGQQTGEHSGCGAGHRRLGRGDSRAIRAGDPSSGVICGVERRR